MENESSSLVCFSSIKLEEPKIKDISIESEITLYSNKIKQKSFTLRFKYQDLPKKEHLPFFRLASIMPLLNYGLFSDKIKLNFPLSKSDLKLIKELNSVFSRDIFVNKILRRRANYILPEYIPNKTKIKSSNMQPKSKIIPLEIVNDDKLKIQIDTNRCGILSSGGKESLLTYGILNEIGCEVFPFYVNESGGHWRTAIPAYRYHNSVNSRTRRVWTNVDRFYLFMLDNLQFIRKDHRKIRADTYPIRLCIFPFYIYLFLPLFIDNKIGNLLLGSEFDDLRSQPEYLGIAHYYGVYDQHQDFDVLMNSWFAKRVPGLKQWSAVRNISGLIVEKILVNRYPDLATHQRSCHSCHFENGNIVPCGTCSKCLGVLLFLLANKLDPTTLSFRKKDIIDFPKRVKESALRLDQDEKNQSLYLIYEKENIPKVKPVAHVEQIHINKKTCDLSIIPNHLRKKLLKIIEQYTQGFCILENDIWKPIKKNKELILGS